MCLCLNAVLVVEYLSHVFGALVLGPSTWEVELGGIFWKADSDPLSASTHLLAMVSASSRCITARLCSLSPGRTRAISFEQVLRIASPCVMSNADWLASWEALESLGEKPLAMPMKDYLDLVNWGGKIPAGHSGKASCAGACSILCKLPLTFAIKTPHQEGWAKTLAFLSFSCCIFSPATRQTIIQKNGSTSESLPLLSLNMWFLGVWNQFEEGMFYDKTFPVEMHSTRLLTR